MTTDSPPSTSSYALWGWGKPGDEPRAPDLEALRDTVEATLGFAVHAPEKPAPAPALPAPRYPELPAGLVPLASHSAADRARHAIGRSYGDVLRGIRGDLPVAPDAVLRPPDPAAVAAILEWASRERVAVVPFGGGTSVVGGVSADVGGDFAGAVSLDCAVLSGVVELDRTSRAVRVRGGTSGPELESALRPHGLTARFFPQSFEHSTVGGWVATRAAGHFSSRLQHIDDIVEAVRAVTPVGLWDSRRLPASGAGPSPDRLLLGSEGTLGVVTDVWLRVRPRPSGQASLTLLAPDFDTGAAALRQLVQEELAPDVCRLLDPDEARVNGVCATGEAVLLLGAESIRSDPDGTGLSAARQLGAAAVCARSLGLRPAATGEPTGGSWRSAFLRAPLLRELLILLGVIVETFETATTWDRLPELVRTVRQVTREALERSCGTGVITCRITHAYPDGAAPYFTVLAPGQPGVELAQWSRVKAAASDAILAAGGTITHHHGVGRDHLAGYLRQRPDPFAAALAAAKAAVDPAGVLNPGVLLGKQSA